MGETAARGDAEAYAAANVAFHGAIYAGAHNMILADFAQRLRRRLSPFRRAQFRTPGRLPRSHAEHDTVVKAILSSDAASAHAAMAHHVSLVEDAFDELLRGLASPRLPGGASPRMSGKKSAL
jgi:DNA-binding GntR family transcriptional regulator